MRGGVGLVAARSLPGEGHAALGAQVPGRPVRQVRTKAQSIIIFILLKREHQFKLNAYPLVARTKTGSPAGPGDDASKQSDDSDPCGGALVHDLPS